MNKLQIAEQIANNEQILSMPQAISQLLNEAGKEDFSPDRLSKIILKDPAITGRILRLANSPFYQRFGQIKTVNQAVSILGVTTVKCLVLSSSVFNPDKIGKDSGLEPKKYFSYVMSVAAASEKLARLVNYQSAEEALIAGLLHDIGVLYLSHHYPQEYRKVLALQSPNCSLLKAEHQVFGTDHCEVGALLCELWHLPPYISASIAHHHAADDSNSAGVLEKIVQLAVVLSNDQSADTAQHLEQRIIRIQELSEQLKLQKEQVDTVSKTLAIASLEMANYVGVDIGNLDEMLGRANEEIWKSYLLIENLFKQRQELSQSLLDQERARGALQSKNVAMATLSHYVNNAVMAIFGRTQLLRMHMNRGNTEKMLTQLPGHLEVIDRSLKKIVAVLEEMKDISPIDQMEFYNMSEALSIDDRIETRMQKMSEESGLVLPEEASL